MKLIQLVICLTFSLFFIGCNNIQDNKSLIIATSSDNPPYEFIQKGQIIGFDIDIINAIGEKLGKKIVIKNFDFNGLLAALTNKNVDMVIAGVSVSEERKKYVSFSVPYLTTNVSILHRVSDNIKSTQDLKDKIIGVQLGTTWAIIAQELDKQLDIKITYLLNNLLLVEELKSKAIDAIILEELQAKKFIENNPNLSSFNLIEFSSEFAIIMEKDSKFVKEVNKAIRELEENGTINKIRKKWLQ